MSKAQTSRGTYDTLIEGSPAYEGPMGRHIRSFDWSQTSLGPIENWPERLRTMVDVILGSDRPMFIAWGLDCTMIYNDAYDAVFASQHSDPLGTDLRQVWPEVEPHLNPMVDGISAGEHTRVDDVDIAVQEPGEQDETYCRFSFSIIPDEQGGPGGLLCICDQMTAHIQEEIARRKDTEEQLRRSEDRFRRVLDIEGVGVILFNQEGVVIDANDAFLQMTGYGREDVESHSLTWRTMTPPEWISDSLEQLEKLHATGRIGPYEKEYYLKDGSKSWMLFAGAALGDGNIVEHCLDINDRKCAEDALRLMNETLEQRVEERTRQVKQLTRRLTMAEQKERRRIAQILHDDLQQLLFGIDLKLAMIRGQIDTSTDEELVHGLESTGKRVAEAIAITRKLAVDLSPPVLKQEGLTEALKWLQGQMKALHGLHVTLKADDAFLVDDEEVTGLLFQIVRELLFNVKKHAGVDHAEVQLLEDEDHLVIHVIDKGRGFTPDRDAVPSKHFDGFGLYSVQERLRFFGGRLEINTGPDAGTHMTVYAPRP